MTSDIRFNIVAFDSYSSSTLIFWDADVNLALEATEADYGILYITHEIFSDDIGDGIVAGAGHLTDSAILTPPTQQVTQGSWAFTIDSSATYSCTFYGILGEIRDAVGLPYETEHIVIQRDPTEITLNKPTNQ